MTRGCEGMPATGPRDASVGSPGTICVVSFTASTSQSALAGSKAAFAKWPNQPRSGKKRRQERVRDDGVVRLQRFGRKCIMVQSTFILDQTNHPGLCSGISRSRDMPELRCCPDANLTISFYCSGPFVRRWLQ